MGNLSQDTLADIIRNHYVNRDSGILHLAQDDIKKRIYFKKGSMVFANSDVNNDRLGEFLIRNQKIDRKDFELASEVMKGTGKRFGQTIVEMGHMSADEMQDMVVKQIEAIIYSLFEWEDGKHRFEVHEDPVDEDIVLNLSTADIILEGTRRMNDIATISRALGDPHRILRHSDNPLLLYQKISLTPQEGFVLSRVDGISTVTDIAAISPLGEDETLRCVYGLVSAGVLDLEGPAVPTPAPKMKEPVELPKPEAIPLEREPEIKKEETGPTAEEKVIRDDITKKHASLETANHYDLLGITVTATDAEIKKAYYAMAKKYHPDRHHSPYLQDVHGLLEELFVKITNAYQQLSQPLERRRYDTTLRTEAPLGETAPATSTLRSAPAQPTESSEPSPMETYAAKQYQLGKRYFNEMSYFDAIQCLREAVRISPDKVNYLKLLAAALAKNPHWLKEAEEHLHKAIRLDQFDVEAHVSLGEIYEKTGMETRAKKMYQKAYELDPDNEEAQEKVHGKKRSAMDGLKGIFGKKKE